jgi:TPP-dependent indolepyruvate ferredoxin oxidoreductase alpha subunit
MFKRRTYAVSSKQKRGHVMKHFLSGNEAVARGLYEADVRVGSAYPGTPSTEISIHMRASTTNGLQMRKWRRKSHTVLRSQASAQSPR